MWPPMGDVLHLTWWLLRLAWNLWLLAACVAAAIMAVAWVYRLAPSGHRGWIVARTMAAGDPVPSDDELRAAYRAYLRRMAARAPLAAAVALAWWLPLPHLVAPGTARLLITVVVGAAVTWLVVARILAPISVGVRDGLSDREVDR